MKEHPVALPIAGEALSAAATGVCVGEAIDPHGTPMQRIHDAGEIVASGDPTHLLHALGHLIESYPIPSAIFFGVPTITQAIRTAGRMHARRRSA